jgi:AraC family transcriptional regulator
VLSESCLRPVADEVRDVDQLIAETPLVGVGAFRCAPDHPRFTDSGLIRNHCFVFPRTSSVIEHDSGDRFVGDQTRISLYNPGQAYRRSAISAEGDHSDYFVVAPHVLRDALEARRAPTAGADDRRLFPQSHANSDAPLYLRQRRLFQSARDTQLDALEVESAVLSLLDDVLTGVLRPADEVRRVTRPSFVEDAERLLAERYAEALSLDDLSRNLGVSAFHLCRVFRAHTGTSLHQHRDQLRLRAALNRLERDEDLTTIGLDVGYSSHSHFTAAFRRTFGVAPSRLRQ